MIFDGLEGILINLLDVPLNNWSILIKLKFPSDPAMRSLSRGVSEGIDRLTDSRRPDLAGNSVDELET